MALHDKLDRIRLEHLEGILSDLDQKVGKLTRAEVPPSNALPSRAELDAQSTPAALSRPTAGPRSPPHG
jgi:hypothetical protein